MYLDGLGFGAEAGGVSTATPNSGFSWDVWSRAQAISQAAAPVPVPVQITPYVPALPIFANIDNSAFYAAKADPASLIPPAPTAQTASATGQPLPAGITAVDYTATPPKPINPINMALYAIGGIGLLMLLSKRRN